MTDEYVVEAYGDGARRARRGAAGPRRPRRRPRLRLPRPRLRARLSRTASSSAGSPSRTWSRPRPAWRATACCPSSTRSRRSSPSRANEQIYNQASEGSKVVYALHYAGLIPAGPGKSHQSIRDISLLAALPNMAIVQPGSSEEARALVRWAVEEADENVARAARDRSVAAPARASRPGRRCRPRLGAARGTRCGAARLRPGDAARGAARRRAAGRAGRGGRPRRRDAVAQPLRRRLARRRGGGLRARPRARGPRAGRRSRRRRCGPRSRAARSRSSGSRAGPPAARPTRRSASTAWTAPRSPRGSPAGSASPLDEREARLGRPPRSALDPRLRRHGDPSGLRERLDGELAAVYLVPRADAAEWARGVDRRSGAPTAPT